MPAPNEQLRAARRRKRWSQQRAAEEIGIDRKTYLRLETSQTYPQPGTLDLICNAFGLSAGDLGFESTQHSGSRAMVQITDVAPATLTLLVETNDMPDFPIKVSMILAHIIHMIGAWSAQAPHWHEIQSVVNGEICMLDEMLQQQPRRNEHLLSRRQALATLAALPTALLARKFPGQMTEQTMGSQFFDLLSPCAASLTACWHLLKSDDLVAVAQILPQYMPALTALAGQPSLHQQAAAALAVQGNILQAIVTMHQRKGAERERHCREAVRCGYLSHDGTLTATVLMYLGYTYSSSVRPRRPEQAIHAFREALQMLGGEESLLRSDILMGLAEACAQCHDEAKALEYMALAQNHFPTYPEADPSYIYAECGLNTLYQWEGKMYLKLAERYPQRDHAQRAWNALAHSTGTQSINGRSSSETMLYQADAARLRGDLTTYTDHLRDGLRMALSLGSRQRYDEAVEIYRKAPEPWLKEPAIKGLAKDFFRELPIGKGT